ncbi:E3 ubiquitin-protein ligase PUB23-like [Macadamia integrifolia]|uniref:E3 ubiquitin-protein ligase PUB23-like n=1 Tax=Macadamia integrifolia TaxID=60698 RepID=UPI001C52F478|nr:E3 ubiquitin-protein ligase PUB23-like [Macadamia integrifolia]
MEEVDVPSYFLCPISLEIMRDPVTVSSGITYDRESIERCIFSGKNKNTSPCPVTKQPLSSDTDLTPNHTLRRLIQAWCTLNASKGIEPIPTPKPPVDKAQILKLINEGKALQHQMRCLQSLRSIANESERNRRCLESAGAVEFLASIVANESSIGTRSSDEEALYILYCLQISEAGLKKLIISRSNGEDFTEALMRVLQRGDYQSRAYAALLLKSMFEVCDPIYLMNLRVEHFVQIVNVLRDQISQQASKASLQIMVELCQWRRNRIKAVEAGAVSVLIEILLETTEKRDSEMLLVVLDQLCGVAEGRAELLRHGAGIAVVSKKILRVSNVATDRGVRILSSMSRFSGTSCVVLEMLQVGVVSKLCLVLQMDCSLKTKEKAKEMLKLHSRVWKNSSCVPVHVLSSYP